ncbi:transmembrane protein, putative [Medicago truncatula]|uniref:Transmembrane protein, putative n=1 Tax=Medicago truncatula TaxID=3880 RepID=G7IR34_MEDTR|nr:transmembrane protein, putative [Medicago truncatula]
MVRSLSLLVIFLPLVLFLLWCGIKSLCGYVGWWFFNGIWCQIVSLCSWHDWMLLSGAWTHSRFSVMLFFGELGSAHHLRKFRPLGVLFIGGSPMEVLI